MYSWQTVGSNVYSQVIIKQAKLLAEKQTNKNKINLKTTYTGKIGCYDWKESC